MASSEVSERLEFVRGRIAAVQDLAGLSHPVRIVAVTKGWGVEAVQAALAAGLTDVGENRVQEGAEKRTHLGDIDATWHLIGHLQRNKAGAAVRSFDYIQSVDSIRLADALAKQAGATGRIVPVLLQVNAAHEPQKSGCAPEDVERLADHVGGLAPLALRGVMGMAPFTGDETLQRRAFAALRESREQLIVAGHDAGELSIGMSNDYETAVAEGATILRLGTVLFGERPT